jgi:hypothetical protein
VQSNSERDHVAPFLMRFSEGVSDVRAIWFMPVQKAKVKWAKKRFNMYSCTGWVS